MIEENEILGESWSAEEQFENLEFLEIFFMNGVIWR